jgi:transcriptional regulator with PAS, ATPase and Fis domain
MKLLNKGFLHIEIDKEVWEAFYSYSWPGNVRELENTIEFMINMMDMDGRVTLDIIPRNILYNNRKASTGEDEVRCLKDMEKAEIEKALKKYGNDTRGKKIAAAKLGVGIATLYRKVEEYKLSK